LDFLKQPLKDHFKWRELTRFGSLEDYKQVYPVVYDSWNFVNKKLKVGIEVEVEQVRRDLPDRWPHFWTIKEDGSLRNQGLEFITAPIVDDEIAYTVNWLFANLPIRADFSERTSIHVHVNCRNRSTGDILNIMLLYLVFEKLLYQFAGPERYKNIFCVPIQETKLPIILSNYLANGRFGDLLQGWAKYSGLNLLPLKTLGSIEFRHMQGHRDPVYLLNWINILYRLYNSACDYEFRELFNQIKVLNSTSNYEQFLQEVFHEEAKHFSRAHLQDDMEYGVSVVKAVQPPSPFITNLIQGISNNSPLLKSLNLDETKTKKVKQAAVAALAEIPVMEEFHIDIDDVENLAPAPAPRARHPAREWAPGRRLENGMWAQWNENGFDIEYRYFFDDLGGWIPEAEAIAQGRIV
jgi:hypothetical protein